MNSGFSDSVYLDRLCVPPSCTNSPTFPKNIKEGIVPASVTSASAYFQNCNRLEKFVLKANVVSIPTNCFYENWSLKEFEIPQGKTQIASGAFANCYQLKKVNIPASVTSIGNQAFQNCYYMEEIKFEGATPPTVSSSNAFTNLSPICRILVPAGSLSAYQSATNYPSSSTYTYEEY